MKNIYIQAQEKRRRKRFLKILNKLNNKDKSDSDLQDIWRQYIELIAGGNDTATSIAVIGLKPVISHIPDKHQAWEDLLRMVSKTNRFPIELSGPIFYYIFEYLLNKQTAWEDLYKLTNSNKINVRLIAAFVLGDLLSLVPDKQIAWKDLHNLVCSEDAYIRKGIAKSIGTAFPNILNKQEAWTDLQKLICDQNASVRVSAIHSVNSVFPYVPDKQKAWEDLQGFLTDTNVHIRFIALGLIDSKLIASNFAYAHNSEQTWRNLLKIATEEEEKDWLIKFSESEALATLYLYIPNKERAWEDLHKLVNNENEHLRECAAKCIGTAFQHLKDKVQVWEDLHILANDEDSSVRSGAATSFGIVFQYVENKAQAWEELHKLANDEDISVRSSAVNSIGIAFQHIDYKIQAWEDLHRLVNDENYSVRSAVASSIGTVFQHIDYKVQAWEDLHRLTNDENESVRSSVASSIETALHYIENKKQASETLHKLTEDESEDVRTAALFATVFSFSDIPDKIQAWNDLLKFINEDNRDIRMSAASLLCFALSDIEDNESKWEDLHKLTYHHDSYVRAGIVYSIRFLFPKIIDKQQAWEDLHRLVEDEISLVRECTAESLEDSLSYLPDQKLAYGDLTKLANDEDTDVRIRANHSLGKISVFKASEAETEEKYKEELENAIEFFDKSSKESVFHRISPSKFCLPFYRSFHTIIFEKSNADEEVGRYLAEARKAIERSERKELLFEAIESLAKALREVQESKKHNLRFNKSEIDCYRRYFDRVEELMRDAEESAPFATKTVIKGLPILDRKLNSLLEEIREKAKTACQISQGTPTQEIACVANRKVQGWKAGTEEEIAFDAEDLLIYMKSSVPRFLENEHIFEKIKEIEDKKDLNLLLRNIRNLFEELPKIMIDPERMKPTIGIITALPKEYAAVSILLENKKDKYKVPGSGASRRYCLGEIPTEEGNKHSLVLANAGMGNNIAATRASLLLEHFPNVKSIIMVGIAGGVPNPDKVDDHVRLGDIVVSNENGVIQYDLIKQEIHDITHRNPPRPPSASLLEAVKYLEAEEILGNRPWKKYIDQSLSIIKTIRPSEDTDILYCSDSPETKIKHPKDPKRIEGQSRVFTGPIASANILQKDPKARDKLRDKFGVKAIEMEASGIADATWNHEVGYLVVRGICDYCDSHKNDEWQQYAAIVAAAYTRALIESMP